MSDFPVVEICISIKQSDNSESIVFKDSFSLGDGFSERRRALFALDQVYNWGEKIYLTLARSFGFIPGEVITRAYCKKHEKMSIRFDGKMICDVFQPPCEYEFSMEEPSGNNAFYYDLNLRKESGSDHSSYGERPWLGYDSSRDILNGNKVPV